MIRLIRRLVARHQFNRLTREFDRRIAKARAKHGRVREIQAEKSRFVHECLKGMGA